MHLFYQPDLAASATTGLLTEDDSRHAVKTLRLGVGEAIAVTDGHGNRYSAVISQADARKCGFRVVDVQTTPPRPFSIRICVAPTKNIDRIEWFIEKAVEIGIERISFFFGQHSERRVLKPERLEKIAVAAMKQSLQSFLPQLDEATPFPQLLATVTESQRFIAHLPDNEQPLHLGKQATAGGEYTVLIGPEGDFAETEVKQAIDAGFQIATLGPNRLRTETAALTACQVLNFINA
ncbi:16S rRNA (uracil(1498)-N(3))-methyltransferase [Spirosoma sp. KUDC1026]|uniref:16S rRNA (uracil(1498)-N(3))-methyltransferase n=1 Tax=Spirosoma sp. KUDC1026 TaxID=2745947 RepID=UPI00159BABF0|nr:16S rRNA (uracil(1498)-N(3))-methyltransferase [Spirosoma sp. KUDC1026]QKZ13078.1 16S rRNA (uracil(1498)-N(3))-methyltransferase [Spirosoma sp. KUDC1026]